MAGGLRAAFFAWTNASRRDTLSARAFMFSSSLFAYRRVDAKALPVRTPADSPWQIDILDFGSAQDQKSR